MSVEFIDVSENKKGKRERTANALEFREAQHNQFATLQLRERQHLREVITERK